VQTGADAANAEDDRALVTQVERRIEHRDVVELDQAPCARVDAARVVDEYELDARELEWARRDRGADALPEDRE
jgi:hypothetical protein